MKNLLAIFLLSISLFFYTNSNAQNGLNVNDFAPNFSTIDQNGNRIVLKELLKNGPVVMIFYRGEWCPYCNKQLMELQDSLALITKMGAKLIAISPEKPENIIKTIEKTNATYSIISDDSLNIMSAYKVAFELDKATTIKYKTFGINLTERNGNNGNNLPVPAVYIINKEGKIAYRYFDTNYKNRVSVSTIIKHL